MRIVVSTKRCKHDSCKPEKKDKMENAFGRKRNCIREALKGRDMSSMLNESVELRIDCSQSSVSS